MFFSITSHHRSITQLTFNVNLPVAGDYAINISYLSPGARFLDIGINNRRPEHYQLKDTGIYDCDDVDGSSTVVAVELKGFTEGTNIIKLGNDEENPAPFIEWISVVVPTDT
jgi:hypothetical protein